METEIPDLLFHITLTITHEDAIKETDVLGTFTELATAKSEAVKALLNLGYQNSEFETYEENDRTRRLGDGVIVYAKAPKGQMFEVKVDTTPNNLKFVGNEKNEVDGVLHYILQTTINYNADRTGCLQTTNIEGTYPTRKEAFEAARTALLDAEITKESFAEYEEKAEFPGEWPYGEEVLVHAVGDNGENYRVEVKGRLGREVRRGAGHRLRHHERQATNVQG